MNLVLEGKAQTSVAGTLLEGPIGKVDRSGKSKSHFDWIFGVFKYLPDNAPTGHSYREAAILPRLAHYATEGR